MSSFAMPPAAVEALAKQTAPRQTAFSEAYSRVTEQLERLEHQVALMRDRLEPVLAVGEKTTAENDSARPTDSVPVLSQLGDIETRILFAADRLAELQDRMVI